MDERTLIWGAGAIGGTVGAYLVRAGHDVTFVDVEAAHVAAIRETGLRITGPVDAFFDYEFGKLPYRSLQFRFETHDTPKFQEAPVVNYPNEYPYTRCTEFKYLTGQEHSKTTLVYEYPQAEGDPYYPIPRPENQALYKRYEALADATPDVWFVGRLATYRYYNMDQIVGQALATFGRLDASLPPRAANDAVLVEQRLAAAGD